MTSKYAQLYLALYLLKFFKNGYLNSKYDQLLFVCTDVFNIIDVHLVGTGTTIFSGITREHTLQ